MDTRYMDVLKNGQIRKYIIGGVQGSGKNINLVKLRYRGFEGSKRNY